MLQFGRKGFLLACLCGVLFCATNASAGFTFNGTFNGVAPGTGSLKVDFGTSLNTTIGGAGLMKWTSDPTLHTAFSNLNSQTGNNFVTFCIDLQETVSGYNKLEVKHLKDLPTPPVGGMGLAKANDIAKLWGKWKAEVSTVGVSGSNYNLGGSYTSVSRADFAAAMQIAVWEIVYEATGTGYDTTTKGAGGFKVITAAAGLTGLANHLLNGMSSYSGPNANLAGFRVTTTGGATRQDQVGLMDDDWYIDPMGNLVEVPVPPAVVLVVAGIASGLFLRRRIAGQQAAVVA